MALLRPTELQPSKPLGTQAIDASINQTFTARVASTIDAYELEIFNTVDNSMIFTSTKENVTLAKGEILQMPLPANSINNGLSVKWRVTIFSGTDEITSFETVVDTAKTPVVTLTIASPVQSQQLTIMPTYTQEQDVDWRSYQVFLRDEDGTIRFQSDPITTGALEYTVTGLVDNTADTIEVIFIALNGLTATTGRVEFTVDYNAPSVNILVDHNVNENTSGVELTYPAPIVIGSIDVGTPSFVENFFAPNIFGMELDDGESVAWLPQGGINAESTSIIYPVQFDDDTDKDDIITYINSVSGATLKVVYESGTFYSIIDGIRTAINTTTLIGKTFGFVIYTNRVRIIEYN